ncbi:GvpL/GvpF family gas vesicle protein [Streptomyces sp. NPDC018833]|uniref:GvpL/GvpF family gas vesicle protein n=1 Tax=Streptomyces sp. NPDC018833 TaxID=3365053 RepID=UPI0037896A29
MPTYVYAITRADHPLHIDDVPGVGDPPARLRAVTARDLTAVVSEAPPGLRAKRRDVLAHQQVIERLMGDGATLPMRFGLLGPDDDQVAAVLEREQTGYSERLAELDGHVEFHLTVSRDEDDLLREIMTQSEEIRLLNERTRNEPVAHHERVALGEMVSDAVTARRQSEAEELVALLAPAAARTARGEGTGTHFLNVSFLLRSEDTADFSRRVRQEAERRGSAYQLTLTGPLPPYSFV